VTAPIVAADELGTVVGLPDQIAQRDAATIEVLRDAGGKDGLAAAERRWAKAQNSRPLRTSRAVYSSAGRPKAWACGQ